MLGEPALKGPAQGPAPPRPSRTALTPRMTLWLYWALAQRALHAPACSLGRHAERRVGVVQDPLQMGTCSRRRRDEIARSPRLDERPRAPLATNNATLVPPRDGNTSQLIALRIAMSLMASPLVRHLAAARQTEVVRMLFSSQPAWACMVPLARHFADKPAADKLPEPPASASAAASESSTTEGSAVEGVEKEEVWTEVVHQTTGQMYYWNQVRMHAHALDACMTAVHARMHCTRRSDASARCCLCNTTPDARHATNSDTQRTGEWAHERGACAGPSLSQIFPLTGR